MAKYNSGAWMSAAEMNEERMGLMAAPPSGWREMAYIRRHPVYGYEPTAFYTHLDRPMGSSAGAGPSGSQKQGSKQLNPTMQPPVNQLGMCLIQNALFLLSSAGPIPQCKPNNKLQIQSYY